MENASKALLMAAGILIGILILALMVTLFVGSSNLANSYDKTKKAEAIQQFNVNFTKYLGEDRLTIHEVVTICNFADKDNNKIHEVTITGKIYTEDDIKTAVNSYSTEENSIKKYTLKINSYSEEGYVNSISFE